MAKDSTPPADDKSSASAPEAVAPQDSPKIEDRQAVAETAFQRQLNNKPERKKRKIKVTATIKGEEQTSTVVARDTTEAWALFCDGRKDLPEGLRSQKFARPTFVDLGEAA